MRVLRERQLVADRPKRDLDEGEENDADGHRLCVNDRLRPPERARGKLEPTLRRQRPDEKAREDDREDAEPDDPVDEPQQTRPLDGRQLGDRPGSRSLGGLDRVLGHAVPGDAVGPYAVLRATDLGVVTFTLFRLRRFVCLQGASPIWIA